MTSAAVIKPMTAKPTILYNGACPICRREIEHYRRLDNSGAEALAFNDISESEQVPSHLSLTQDDAKRRLHVLDVDGRLLRGIPAFAAIWDCLPKYRWLSALTRFPVLRSLLPWLYEPIAFGLYLLDKRRQSRSLASVNPSSAKN